MRDNCYKIAGNIEIPEEKKEEFNQYILQILHRGGIRKTGQVELGGKKVTIVSCLAPDQHGIVSFDYSIFEKEKRETATYNNYQFDYTAMGAFQSLLINHKHRYEILGF